MFLLITQGHCSLLHMVIIEVFLVLILEIEKLDKKSDNSKIQFYKKHKQLYLQHYEENFLVKKYIYKGKLTSI